LLSGAGPPIPEIQDLSLAWWFSETFNPFPPPFGIPGTLCFLLNLTTYFGTNLNKHCSGKWYEQLFFKYFPIHTLDLEKMCADDVVCSSLGLNEVGWWFSCCLTPGCKKLPVN
jgi:hypothetical protein